MQNMSDETKGGVATERGETKYITMVITGFFRMLITITEFRLPDQEL